MNLIETTTKLAHLIDCFADDHIVRELNALATKLKEQRFYIVVVGFFKPLWS